jgi:uncharacterized protein with HEPN domain
MLDAAALAVEFCTGRTRADLDPDAMLTLALTRLVEIIGEAAKHVSGRTRALAPGIPWREIAGARDRLAHGYFEVDLDILWNIATVDLPALRPELERLLAILD